MKKFLLYSLFGIFLFGSLKATEPGLYFSIDYLYWKFEQEQTYFVGIQTGSDIDLKGQKFGFSSGFRAEIGYTFFSENYDVSLDWTRFRVDDTVEYSFPSGTPLLALDLIGFTNVGDVAHSQSAESDWHLSFDILDLKLGGSYFIGNRITLHPNCGVRGGRINQTQIATYGNAEVDPGVFVTATANLKNDFCGAGLMAGLDSHFYLGWQTALFCSLSGAFLYGHYDIETTFSVPTSTTFGLDNSRNGVAPAAQILLGADWKGCLCNRWPVSFGAGYEAQFWWNMVRTNSNLLNALYINYRGGGNLFSQGLTLHTAVGF